jgi:hypothetical protein
MKGHETMTTEITVAVAVGDNVQLDLLDHEGAGGATRVVAFVTRVDESGAVDVAWRDAFFSHGHRALHERFGVPRTCVRRTTGAPPRELDPRGPGHNDHHHVNWVVLPNTGNHIGDPR